MVHRKKIIVQEILVIYVQKATRILEAKVSI